MESAGWGAPVLLEGPGAASCLSCFDDCLRDVVGVCLHHLSSRSPAQGLLSQGASSVSLWSLRAWPGVSWSSSHPSGPANRAGQPRSTCARAERARSGPSAAGVSRACPAPAGARRRRARGRGAACGRAGAPPGRAPLPHRPARKLTPPGAAGRQPATVFGRDAASADVVLDHASCSGRHAAVVHHQDARIFLIDLQSVRAAPAGAPARPRRPLRAGPATRGARAAHRHAPGRQARAAEQAHAADQRQQPELWRPAADLRPRVRGLGCGPALLAAASVAPRSGGAPRALAAAACGGLIFNPGAAHQPLPRPAWPGRKRRPARPLTRREPQAPSGARATRTWTARTPCARRTCSSSTATRAGPARGRSPP